MLDQVMEQLNGPVGIGIAVVAGLLALFVLRKLLSLVFLVLSLMLVSWGAARYFGWDVPYVLPGQITEAAREAIADARRSLEANAVVGPEAVGATVRGPGAEATPEAVAARAVAESVRTAELRYNAPDTLLLNVPVDMRLVVDASGMARPEDLLEGLPGEVREGQAELTSQVTASLYGSGFEIRPLKPERQVLAEATASSWQWEVTPRQAGTRTLILEVFAHPGGGDAAAPVREFRDEIEVQVTFVSRALGFVQTAHPVAGFAAAAVSLLIAAVGMVRGRRKKIVPW